MTMVWNQVSRLTVVLVLLLGLTLVGPLATSAQNGGNSDAAKACQQGRFASLARAKDPGTPFVNTGDCVSYAARGGTIVPVRVADLSIMFNQTSVFGGSLTTSGSGLAPGSPVTVDVFRNGRLVSSFGGPADADGNFTDTRLFGCSFFSSLTVNGVALGGTPISESATPPC